MRAEVIMPRSPTMTMSVHPEHGLHLDRDLLERGRVGRVPRHHPNRDGASRRVGEQAVLDLRQPA